MTKLKRKIKNKIRCNGGFNILNVNLATTTRDIIF
jgi:hypothetical protein